MMFSLNSVGRSISASGFGPGGPNLGGSKSVRTPATVVEFNLVAILIDAFMNDNEYRQENIGRRKKRRNLPNWFCFTAKRNEDYSIERLRHVMASRQSSHSMTSYPQQIAVPFAVCIFGGFGEMPWRPSPPKIQGCRIDQQIQRWLKDQLQDSIANKGMAWPSRHATTIRHNIEIFQVILSNLMFRQSV